MEKNVTAEICLEHPRPCKMTPNAACHAQETLQKLAEVRQSSNLKPCSCFIKLTDLCKAGNYLSIYFANKDAPKGPQVNPGPPGWTSYGCWQDSGNPRTLGHTMGDIQFSNMTVALCTSACKDNGYALAGVEYSGECYCVCSKLEHNEDNQISDILITGQLGLQDRPKCINR